MAEGVTPGNGKDWFTEVAAKLDQLLEQQVELSEKLDEVIEKITDLDYVTSGTGFQEFES